MRSEIIFAEGNFSAWLPEYLAELETYDQNTKVGEKLVYQDNDIKVWSIKLLPKQRLPFHTHTHDYNWTCLTVGSAISKYANGKIAKITYDRGDISFYQASEKGSFTHDLQNIGDTTLIFTTVEYLK